MKHVALALATLAFAATSLPAAPAGNSADGILRGPFFSGTIMSGDGRQLAAGKGIVVTVGPNKDHYLCYDTDTLRCAMGWSGDFLEFGKTQERIEWPPPPKIKGRLAFEARVGPGWAKPGSMGKEFADPRPNQLGPLPTEWAKYRGIYVNGGQVVLAYTVGKAEFLELPGLDSAEGLTFFTRTIQSASDASQHIALGDLGPGRVYAKDGVVGVIDEQGNAVAFGCASFQKAPYGVGLDVGIQSVDDLKAVPPAKPSARRVVLFNKTKGPFHTRVLAWSGPANLLDIFALIVSAQSAPNAPRLPDLKALTKGGPAQWPAVVTRGVPGTGNAPYVVDQITEPVPNPWNAKTYFGGHDFFPDGRAAVCTFHGDVWIVSGLDDKLERITWKRFATGLFQPLGLKIVDGKIYVTGRDQITRLHDLNGDGEADFYENFNNDTFVTANYHEFCLDLDTDRAGNFYFAKGAPWPPTVQSAHQGTLLKVSPDGSQLSVVATGLRAPNGLAVGPNGWITVSDNEGHYMPSSKLNLVREGGFYGMRQTAHGKAPPDDKLNDYDQPICWLPKNMDNSSGGQVWVTSKRWGPLDGQLLFMSYGKGTLFSVMPEEVDGVVQAGMVQLPLKFPSGTMRGRFNPKDGQLYVSGLRGWQTAGVRDGGFTRVRYTGAPVDLPHTLHATKAGLQITFTRALDTASAADAANWAVERWNYLYSANYGSKEYLTQDFKTAGHDKLDVRSVRVMPDKKTVFLEIPDMKPVMQMKVRFNLRAADGATVSQEIYSTVHKLAGK